MSTTPETQTRGAIFAERLGLTILGRDGHNLKLACITCDSSDAFRIHQDDGVGYCHSCQSKYSRLQLAQKILGSESEAWSLLIKLGLEQPRHNGNGHANGSPTPNVLEAVAREKSVSADALRIYGAKVVGGVLQFPMYDGNCQQCSTFTLKPGGGKGLCEKGKKTGVFLPHDETGAVRSPKTGESWHVVEGVKDSAALLALGKLALGLPGCTMGRSFGRLLAGVDVVLIPDRDEPSTTGADKTARILFGKAKSVRVVTLPAEFSETKGADVRDVLKMTNGAELVEQAIDEAKPWTPPTAQEAADDQKSAISKITNAIEVVVASDSTDAGTKTILQPLPMEIALGLIRSQTGDWPRRMGPALFVPNENGGVSWLTEAPALFGWFASRTGIIKWHKCNGAPSKAEVFAEVLRTTTAYQAIEELPHYPPMANTYYACHEYQPGDGSALRGLLDRFNPATDIDRDLIQAAIMTPFWGGPPGSRPAFLFTADEGRGKGKSTVAQKIIRIAGGAPDVSPHEKMEDIKKRFLNGVGRTKRCGFLDNVKTHKFSWAELESLITADTISGWMLFNGDGARPNTVTWFITLNGASLSTDLAQRCVIVKIGGPVYSGEWESELDSYIEARREAIIADCIGALIADPMPLAKYSRWGTWERDVLSRLPEPAEAQRVVLERQGSVDVDKEEAEIVAAFFEDELGRLSFDLTTAYVFIPSAIVARWLELATGEKRATNAAGRIVGQFIDERRLPRFKRPTGKANGRGVLFVGDEADVNKPADVSLQFDPETKKVTRATWKQPEFEDGKGG